MGGLAQHISGDICGSVYHDTGTLAGLASESGDCHTETAVCH